MWNYLWPVLLVISMNIVYHVCSKQIPNNVQPFAALIATYFVSMVTTLIFYFITSETKSLVGDFKNLNWASYLLGIALVGLEFGFVQMYRAGWNISIGSLVANIGLAVVLIFVGLLIYHESVSVNQIIGIVLCIAGLVFINK